MNDRHSSGTLTTPAPASEATATHYASYGGQEAQYGDFTTYGGYDAGGSLPGAQHITAFETDPLYGALPGEAGATGAYDTTHWSTGAHHTLNYDPYAAQHHAAYDSGAYDATAWTVPQQQGVTADTSGHTSGQWDAGSWLQTDQLGGADPTQQWEWGTQAFDTGAYDATQWNSGDAESERSAGSFGRQATGTFEQPSYEAASYEASFYEETPLEKTSHDGNSYVENPYAENPYAEGPFEEPAYPSSPYQGPSYQSSPYQVSSHPDFPYPHTSDPGAGYPDSGHEGPADEEPAPGAGQLAADGELPEVAPLLDGQEESAPVPVPRAGSRSAARSRRRTPAKRSALLTIAVPSACVMGVAGIAAASVGGLTDDGTDTTASAPDAQAVKPSAANNKLDTQLKSLAAGADDFANRASRTQERIDLKVEQEAEKKKALAEAAQKERMRPKFVLPVTQRGLSAYFGQAGVNWMSVHTGIDFPVSYGTTVMAATDGTARTQWNSAYGNMMIVTAMDGTETWYCHLSRYQVSTGTSVKAGQPIAYSGNSGNSTGPHLHFEVRPAGGAAIDPLPWLRSHGLDPT